MNKPSLFLFEQEKEVHIWQVNLSALKSYTAQFINLLSMDEKVRFSKFKFTILQEKFAIGRASLKILLSKYLEILPKDVVLSYTKSGKPFLSDSNLCFNLSHSGDYALIAITNAQSIGIDIEEIKPIDDLDTVAKLIFSEKEYHHWLSLSHMEQESAFYQSWVKKEALSKGTGEGLNLSFNTLEVNTLSNTNPTLVTCPFLKEERLWEIYNLDLNNNGYRAALATAFSPSSKRMLDVTNHIQNDCHNLDKINQDIEWAPL